MHHTAVAPVPLPYISWELTRARHICLGLPGRARIRRGRESSAVFKNLEFLVNLVQDTVCYCKGVGGGGNPAGRAQASGSSPVNKVIVEGLFTEQSGTVHRAECQRVRNGGARRRGLERDERNCLMFSHSYQA